MATTTELRPMPEHEPEVTRSDVAEALGNLLAFTKRQQHVVERYEADQPTAWTRAHRRINEWLTQVDALEG